MPVLIEFIKAFKPKRIIEFGSGLFSTQLFVDNCENVTSIENDREWYDYMSKKINHPNYCLMDHEKIKLFFMCLKDKSDLIFVDGENPREDYINASFGYSDTIICHDTQLHFTRNIKKPKNYTEITFRSPVIYKTKRKDSFDNHPWTTVFTKDGKIMNLFMFMSNEELYSKYQFPYGVEE